jgi:outer membrane receptor for ferrienterochelin and colicins
MWSKIKPTILSLVTFLFALTAIQAQITDSVMAKIYAMDIDELMNVKITTAGKKAEKVSEIPASVVLLTREDIKTSGYTTLAEVLANVPGMFTTNDYYATGSSIGIRGFCPGSDGHNVIILVNGVNQIFDITSAYALNKIAVPVEAIDRIEVIRGPMSVVYGSGAFYGVINIITNEATKSELSTSAGSLKTVKVYGRSAGSQGDFSYVVNGSVYNTHGLDIPISKMSSPSKLALLVQYFGIPNNYSTGGRLAENQKYMSFSCTYKSLTFDFSYADNPSSNYYLYPSPSSNGSIWHTYSTNAFVNYKKALSKYITLDGKFTYSANRLLSDYNYLFNDFYGNQQNESNALEGELNAFIKVSSQFDITCGLYCRSILNVYNMFNLPSFGDPSEVNQYLYLNTNDNITTRSCFTQLNYQPFYNLKFVAGLRVEQMPAYSVGILVPDSTGLHFPGFESKYSETKIAFIPRLAAIWSLNERNIFKIMYGRAINRPSFFQVAYTNFNPLIPHLQPEWITTYELNYISYISDKFVLNAGLFYNSLDNLISRESNLDTALRYSTWFGNGGKMTTTGLEITIQANPVKNCHVELSGTLQKTKNQRKGFENIKVAYSPETLGYLKVSYGFIPGMTIAATGNYVGDMLPFYDEAYGNRIGAKVNGYLLLGANLRADDIFNQGYYLNARCNNILNSEIRFPTTTNNDWADKGTLDSGFTFLISIGKKF